MTENSTIHFSYRVSDADQTRHLGEELAHHLRAGDLIMLRGGLGAGKTTLTQGIRRPGSDPRRCLQDPRPGRS